MQLCRYVPHDLMNIELFIPVPLNTRNMTHPDHSNHHSRHFWRKKKNGASEWEVSCNNMTLDMFLACEAPAVLF